MVSAPSRLRPITARLGLGDGSPATEPRFRRGGLGGSASPMLPSLEDLRADASAESAFPSGLPGGRGVPPGGLSLASGSRRPSRGTRGVAFPPPCGAFSARGGTRGGSAPLAEGPAGSAGAPARACSPS